MAESEQKKPLKERIADKIVPNSEARTGSGMTDGVGHGNKTSDGYRKDSIRGKAMEGIGSVVNHEGLQSKGQDLRRQSGWEG
ncbi:hypothetical protein JX265_006172 [Neoarthrinium moseri]|uniref:Uncharacterized protein n=1 Tax=Neoarthrinium moseri TaxID=1658444 RepID=A0A9P9WN68_9PEZI|nr:uncharacterized protein JN550_012576 [Neoarthrinium moseri]KAI1851214.1 hypothetical protein JX266_003289 [Neoarthrinium moseri]KAI1858529.1 hypothetical protein JN550_012576 [Neoarthrinium moseri]KAI1871132.1 hypothetical protein JX265_006172 [Neoarthrinium moseri]